MFLKAPMTTMAHKQDQHIEFSNVYLRSYQKQHHQTVASVGQRKNEQLVFQSYYIPLRQDRSSNLPLFQ